MARKTWDELSAQMDAAVDDRLGDTIEYSIDGRVFTSIPGFVVPDGQGMETDNEIGMDQATGELGTDVLVKVRRTLIPGGPKRSHRLKSAKLGSEVYRPIPENMSDQGRYYVFCVQKGFR